MNLPNCIISFIGSVCLCVTTLQAEVKNPPNIIIILADDMGIDAVSAFNEKLGLKTSNIDQLAAQGMSFMDAHSTSAVCTPTRYSVLTGRYNWRSRLKRGIVGKWERPLIEDNRLTLPEMTREHGYQTACIGKWHLGWSWPKNDEGFTENLSNIDFSKPVKGGPNDHGFDSYFGDDVPNWPPYVWRENDQLLGDLSTQMKAGTFVGVSSGPAVADWDFRAVLKEYGDRCENFLRKRSRRDQPFFLYVPLPSPHTPIAPHKDFRGESGISEYADFLMQTDAVIGQILTALEASGQSDQTLLFFTCDNGTSPKANFEVLEAHGVHLREHWRGTKADAYEGGHRVPFIVRWPSQVAAGVRCHQTITLADLMATCAAIMDHKLPANSAEDSVSLLPALLGDDADQPLHNSVVHHSVSGHFSIRKGNWKLLFCRGSGGWSAPRESEAAKQNLPPVQLFNLHDDPQETNNLQAKHPDLVKELTAELRNVVERGRSTLGVDQPNHANATWWAGLPWKND